MKRILSALLLGLLISSCNSDAVKEQKKEEKNIPEKVQIPFLSYSVTATLPHDTTSFTEGFLVNEGQLLESTGSPDYLPQTRSVLGIVDLKTGKINVKAELDKNKYFGEGIVVLNTKIYQATYKNQAGFMYDAKTFKMVGQFSYSNKEGWGLTTDGKSIIMSDGSNVLTFLDPEKLNVIKTLGVNTVDVDAADYLNELEYIKGFIYANIWMTGYIAKIDPASGRIQAIIDFSQLVADNKARYSGSLEMNGIAYNATADKIYVTGKFWPHIYEVNFPH
jgi:glutaminyl-peptide cyclotransferase